MAETSQICIRLDDKLIKKLSDIAENEERRVTDVLRSAVNFYLDKRGKK